MSIMTRYILSFLCFFLIGSLFGQRYSEDEIKLQDLYLEATQYKILDKYDKALEVYAKILESEPLNAAVHHDMARLYAAQEDYDNALKSSKKSVRYAPTNEWYLVTLAEISKRDNDLAGAASAYRKILRLSDDPSVHGHLVEVLLQDEKPSEALEIIALGEEKYGLRKEWTDQKVQILLDSERSEDAIGAYQQWTETFPEDIDQRLKLGDLYQFLGKKDKAQAVYELVISMDPDNEVAAFNLQKLLSTGDEKEKSDGLTRMIQDPRIGMDKKILSLVPAIESFIQSPNEQEALHLKNLANSLVEQYPDAAKPYALLGDILSQSGQYADAIGAYEATLERDKSVYLVWDQLMACLAEQKEFDKLKDVAENAMDYYPNQAGPLYYLAKSEIAAGEYAEAESWLDEAQFMAAGNKEVKTNLGLLQAQILDRQSNTQKAIEYLQDNLDNFDQNSPILFELLGDLHIKLGIKDRALQYWKEAIEKGGDKIRLDAKLQGI